MPQITAFALAKHFTLLVGRPVTFALKTAGPDKPGKYVYGIYTVTQDGSAIVVKGDLGLMCSFAGALVGLPASEVSQMSKASPIDEILLEATHETLNVAAGVIATDARAVFVRMTTDPVSVDGAAGDVLAKPNVKMAFDVTVEGYEGGVFTVLK